MSSSSGSPRKCRIVLCMGQYCNRGGQAEPLYNRLTELLGERRPAWSATGPVRWEIATCLSMCGAGPNLVVYPDDMACNHLDIATLEAVVEDVMQRANSGG
jgi:(2Fe-2S) ferredoxin